MVLPARLASSSSSRMATRASGSSADVGSSRISNSGSLISACASPMRCCMPRENFAHIAVGFRFQFHLPQDLAAAQPQPLGSHAVQRAVEAQQLGRGTMIEGDILRQKADARARIRVAKGFAQQLSRPRRRPHESKREMDGSGLPCSVGPEETEDLAALQRQREAVERAHPLARPGDAVIFRDVLVVEDAWHRSRSGFYCNTKISPAETKRLDRLSQRP